MHTLPPAFLRFTRQASYWLRWVIELLILATLVFGIIGFLVHWSPLLGHPQLLLSNLRGVMEDIFTLVLLVEMRDLFRHLSPPRLLDIVATILARQLVLSRNFHEALTAAAAIALIVLIRGLWSRFFVRDDETP